jgi:hypothetical protein
LFVNSELLIDEWHDQLLTEHSGTIDLVAGERVDIQLDYYDNVSYAEVHLEWASASVPRQIVPASHLYPPVPPLGVFDPSSLAEARPVLAVASPAAQASVVRFMIPRSGFVRVTLYDVGGRARSTLFEGHVEGAQERRLVVGNDEYPNGVYFVELAAGPERVSRKLLITR